MKNLIIITVILLAACQPAKKGNEASGELKTEVVQLVSDTINVSGMHCDMCVSSIEKGVGELEGVEFVQATLSDSIALVRYDASKTGPNEIEKAIEKRGYSVK